MSELLNTREIRKNFHSQLLATVSAIALIGSACGAARAADDNNDRPLVWIELGGQLSRLDDGQEVFAPPIMARRPSIFEPSQKFERPPLYTIDETGRISFEPEGSDWILSASVRYGHSVSNKDFNQQTHPKPTYFHYTFSGVPHTLVEPRLGGPNGARFADTSVQNGEHHLVLDFQAGKDVGLGMFSGRDGSSVLDLGVRFAQFNSNSNIALKSDPDWHRLYKYVTFPGAGINHEKLATAQPYHSNAASIIAARNFHGVGPSISWNASTPFAGSTNDGELLFDWGANAALLFGRQKAAIHHQSTVLYQNGHLDAGQPYLRTMQYRHATNPPARTRTVIVPNVGGFAGLTFRVENFKMSAGYRADFFFGAMDGGIDAAKKENVGFYGPFASVSIGLGR